MNLKWFRIKNWYRMKWMHWKLVPNYKLNRLQSQLSSEQYSHQQTKRERSEKDATLERILPRLVSGQAYIDEEGYGRYGNRYRFVVELSRTLAEDALIWGNDDNFIKHIADYCGHLCYRELKTCNMKRFSDVKDIQLQGYRYTR